MKANSNNNSQNSSNILDRRKKLNIYEAPKS